MPSWLKTLLGLVLGFMTGGAVTGFVMGVVASNIAREKAQEVRAVEMANVVVAAEDLPSIHRLAFNDLATRSVPVQLATKSVVTPDSANYVVEQPLGVPLRAGDVLQWSYFMVPGAALARSDADLFDGCLLAIATTSGARLPERSSAEIRARLAREAR